MTSKIKYTVKHCPRPVKKVGSVFSGIGILVLILFDLIWAPFSSLTPELQALAILYIIPEIFWDINTVAFLCLAIGFGLWLLRWRTGMIELTEERLIIRGSYDVSIWLRNMWEVDVRDMNYHRWIIRLDSNVEAVQIKFSTEKEFENFSEKLVELVANVENIKLKISA